MQTCFRLIPSHYSADTQFRTLILAHARLSTPTYANGRQVKPKRVNHGQSRTQLHSSSNRHVLTHRGKSKHVHCPRMPTHVHARPRKRAHARAGPQTCTHSKASPRPSTTFAHVHACPRTPTNALLRNCIGAKVHKRENHVFLSASFLKSSRNTRRCIK